MEIKYYVSNIKENRLNYGISGFQLKEHYLRPHIQIKEPIFCKEKPMKGNRSLTQTKHLILYCIMYSAQQLYSDSNANCEILLAFLCVTVGSHR